MKPALAVGGGRVGVVGTAPLAAEQGGGGGSVSPHPGWLPSPLHLLRLAASESSPESSSWLSSLPL